DGAIRKRAAAAWKAAGLDGIGLHECRHTFASLMIAASCNAKALSTFMGHSSITITLDRYGCRVRRSRRPGCWTRTWRRRARGLRSGWAPGAWLSPHAP